jgi:hypothetical protein
MEFVLTGRVDSFPSFASSSFTLLRRLAMMQSLVLSELTPNTGLSNRDPICTAPCAPEMAGATWELGMQSDSAGR